MVHDQLNVYFSFHEKQFHSYYENLDSRRKKISDCTFYEKQKEPITSYENALYHPLYGETPPLGPTLYPFIYHF